MGTGGEAFGALESSERRLSTQLLARLFFFSQKGLMRFSMMNDISDGRYLIVWLGIFFCCRDVHLNASRKALPSPVPKSVLFVGS